MTRYRSVLLVDDDPIQVAILKSYFVAMQCDPVLTAQNSTEGLNIVRNLDAAVDLIVTDLQMPEMDGLEFMRHLKTHNFSGKIAIVSGMKEDLLQHAGRLAKMHNLEMIGQISKPVTKDALDSVFLKTTSTGSSYSQNDSADITEAEFLDALAQNRIVPHYQPKIEVKSGHVVGAEALARWHKPDGDIIPPNVFIPFAEHCERMTQLTFHLFDMVLQHMPLFFLTDPNLKIAMNLASKDISNVALPDQLYDHMQAAGITSKNISFEVTEDSILDLNATTLEVLSRLRVLDFDVAIDDFGTGSSNIQTIRDFPYSELKIDRSFISNATTNAFSKETVHAAVSLAHKQGMKVVAEGVEDMKTWQMLRELEIEQAQGYLLAKAMPAEDFAKYVSDNRGGITLVAA